ncbi:MAG: hypothetical protein RMJ29_08880, partial [Candidatus Bipolaricaulota bacterium]|nr:hypothetical protein [Candidatus Bipolaricaulota bacterium]
LTAVGGPGSSSGLWDWIFSVAPAGCGTVNPSLIPPGTQTTVTTTFTAGSTPGPCTVTVTLKMASGRIASRSQTTLIAAGTIVINKTAVGGNDTFSYTSTIPGNATFNITTTGGSGSQTFAGVTAGSYTVTESAPPSGWDFTSLSCVDPDNGTTVSGQTATIDLDPGETVTCTYTNTRRGTIVINKTAVGGNDT